MAMASSKPRDLSHLLENLFEVNPNELRFVEDALRAGKALPLINVILGISKFNHDKVLGHIDNLQKRVEQLERDSHRHEAVHAVQQQKPSMPMRKSYLDGTPQSEGENDDPWASQDEENHKDIKF